MRILVAEDDEELSARIAAALSQAGFAVDRLADGEAIEFAGQTEAYDAAVLDLGLPRIDGLSVLQRWREAGPGVALRSSTASATHRFPWSPSRRSSSAS